MNRLLRLLLLGLALFAATFEGCGGGSGAPKKTKDQPKEMDMDKVPPAKP